jgi:hypothetical protein
MNLLLVCVTITSHRTKANGYLITLETSYTSTPCPETKQTNVYDILYVRPFIHQWLYSPLLGPGLFFSYVIFFTQTVGLLGRVISPSQGLYLHTGQHKHRTNIHALSRIRNHDPSFRASVASSCLTPRGHRDRHIAPLLSTILENSQ